MNILQTALEAIETLLTDNSSEQAQAAAADARIKIANAMTVTPVASLTISNFRGHWTTHDVDYFGSLPEGSYQLYIHPAPQQVAVSEDAILKEIERAIVDHCTGGDLWMSASLAKDRIKRLMGEQGEKP